MGKILTIIILSICIFAVPLGMSSCSVVSASVPFVDSTTMALYISVTQETSSGKVTVDWRDLLAIDAVRYEQNFSKVDSSSIAELCNMFILKTTVSESSVDAKGNHHSSTRIVYTLKSLDTVENELGFNSDQKDLAQNFLDVGLALSETPIPGESSGGSSVPANLSQQAYITKISVGAISTYKADGVFASISIAQSILESEWGRSGLTKEANNLFGIKAYNWSGASITMPTTEYIGGIATTVMSAFRAYSSWDDSVNDHGLFLTTNSVYKDAGVFIATNYVGQAYALQKAGYATDPAYAMLLINLISEYKLAQYDTK